MSHVMLTSRTPRALWVVPPSCEAPRASRAGGVCGSGWANSYQEPCSGYLISRCRGRRSGCAGRVLDLQAHASTSLLWWQPGTVCWIAGCCKCGGLRGGAEEAETTLVHPCLSLTRWRACFPVLGRG